jgi:hypothetical protein
MITFSGIDVVFARPVSAQDLMRALSTLFDVPSSRVAVITDVADYPAAQSVDVVCVTTSVGGDFAQLTSIQMQPRELRYDTIVSFVQSLAEALSVQCIVPDEDIDPSSMILIEPGGAPERVHLDDEALDEDRYVLAQ